MEDEKEQEATQEKPEPEEKPEEQPDPDAKVLTAKGGEEIAEASYAKGKKDGIRQASKTAGDKESEAEQPREFSSQERRTQLAKRSAPNAPDSVVNLLAKITDEDAFFEALNELAEDAPEFSASALVAEKLKPKKSPAQEKTIKPASDTTPPAKNIKQMTDKEFTEQIWEPSKRGERVFG